MSKRKNQNSILVLATLGVYLGLVLVGATPQVLAQAAMARQFNVNDEIEVKEDLDKKPKNGEALEMEEIAGPDQKVSNAVNRFLSQFHTSARDVSFLGPVSHSFDFEGIRTGIRTKTLSNSIETHRDIRSVLTPTNFPRAGLDALLASDAK